MVKGVSKYYPRCSNRQTTNTSGLIQKYSFHIKAKMGVSDQWIILHVVMSVLCILLGHGVFYIQFLDKKGHRIFIGKGRYAWVKP